MTITQVEEAKNILEILDKYFPKRFDAKESIKWLHKHSSQKRQDEWAAFFFEEYSFPLLINFLGGWKGPRITKDKRFDYQREFVWDLKMESIVDKNGSKTKIVPLNDKSATDRILNDEKGIGFIVAKTEFSFDLNGTLKKWRNNFENKIAKKTGSGKTRVLKTNGNVKELIGVTIEGKNGIDKAVKDGWISIFKQGKNSNGKARPPKYQMHVDKIPDENIVRLENS
jgi:hypothetical protein